MKTGLPIHCLALITILTRTKMRGSFTSLSKAGSLLSIGGRERRKGSKVSEMARRVSS